MLWNNVKTMLIILFLCVNIFLAYSMISLYRNTVVISTEVVMDTVDVLGKNNITIAPEHVPNRMHDVSTFNMNRFPLDENQFAFKLMGTDVVKQDGVYTSGNKTMIINQNEFVYTHNMESKSKKMFRDINEYNAAGQIKKRLEQWGIVYAEESSVEYLGSGIYEIVYYQKYQNMRIFSSRIKVTADAYGIISMTGCWTSPQSAGQRKIPLSGTSILIEFISNPNRPPQTVVNKITLGYIADENIYTVGSKVVPAIPAWEIETDDGAKYYYDAIKGEYRGNVEEAS